MAMVTIVSTGPVSVVSIVVVSIVQAYAPARTVATVMRVSPVMVIIALLLAVTMRRMVGECRIAERSTDQQKYGGDPRYY